MKKILLTIALLSSINITCAEHANSGPKNLHDACYNGDVEAVKTYLQQGQRATDLNEHGNTPLELLFTNLGLGLKIVDGANLNNATTAFAIYELLKKSVWPWQNLMNIKNGKGETTKSTFVKELKYWCSSSHDKDICKHYTELLVRFKENNII